MKVMPLVVGLVLAVLSPAAAAEWQIAQWDQTVHYRLTFNAAEATQAALRLTAVNEYEVFPQRRLGGQRRRLDDRRGTGGRTARR